MKILLVYNPHAAHQRAKKLLNPIQNYFYEKGIDLQTEQTQYPGHGIEIVKGIDLSGFDGLVAAGGDGTTFEVLNGYYQNPQKMKPPIGVIPTGTGNAYAREFGLRPSDWERAIEIIREKHTRMIDVGYLKTGSEEYYFVNILGFGFVADVTFTGKKLKRIGNVAYSLAVFYELLRLNHYKLKIYLDGKIIERENIFVEISNTRYTGVNFLMAPEAEVDDGLLDLTLLNKCSRRRILQLFPTIFKGTHIHEPEVESFKVSKIRLETSRPKILTPDGELLGSTPIEVECLKRDLKIFST